MHAAPLRPGSREFSIQLRASRLLMRSSEEGCMRLSLGLLVGVLALAHTLPARAQECAAKCNVASRPCAQSVRATARTCRQACGARTGTERIGCLRSCLAPFLTEASKCREERRACLAGCR